MSKLRRVAKKYTKNPLKWLSSTQLFVKNHKPNHYTDENTMFTTTAYLNKFLALVSVKKHLLFWCCLSLMSSAFHANAGQFDPAKIHWSELTFSTSVLFFKVKAEIKFKKIPATQAASDLIKPNPGDSEVIMPRHDQVYMLSSHTSNFGRNSTLEFWFEDDLTALQRTQTETGRKTIVRTYRFLNSGAYRSDILPAKGEKKLPPAKWTQTSTQFYPYPSELPPYKMTDNNVIFYAVSAANLNQKGDQVTFLTFDKEHINLVELVLEGTEEIETDYVAYTKNGEKRIRETVDALRVSIKSEPVNKNVDKKDFVFLGVKGDISIYIHPQSRMLLQVSGNADYIGHTDITLSRATLD
jgi:hypothetical protein